MTVLNADYSARMSARGRKKPPEGKDVLATALTLIAQIPMDKPLGVTVAITNKGFHFFRFTGITRGREWTVDQFLGSYFIVVVPPFNSFPTKGIFSALTRLKATLT